MTEIVITVVATLCSLAVGAGFTYWIGHRAERRMDESFQKTHGNLSKMDNNFRKTEELIANITGLFAASQMVGIDTAYENREVALLERDARGMDAESFLRHIKTEDKLIVVGSSLLGLRMYIQKLAQYIRARQEKHLETQFLLTHPCFSSLREEQEKRSPGQIQNEIKDTLRFLEKDCGLNLKESVRFYKGTPTCFMILTSHAMLLNPYPYQAEAFKAFCLHVRRLERSDSTAQDHAKEQSDILKVIDAARFESEINELMGNEGEWEKYDYAGDIGPDIYGQFYWFHYFLPWFSKQAVRYQDYTETCEACDYLATGFSKECPFEERRKGIEAAYRASTKPTGQQAESTVPVEATPSSPSTVR